MRRLIFRAINHVLRYRAGYAFSVFLATAAVVAFSVILLMFDALSSGNIFEIVSGLHTLLFVVLGVCLICGGGLSGNRLGASVAGFTLLKVYFILYLIWIILMPFLSFVRVMGTSYIDKGDLMWLEYALRSGTEGLVVFAVLQIFFAVTDMILAICGITFFSSIARNIKLSNVQQSAAGKAFAVMLLLQLTLSVAQFILYLPGEGIYAYSGVYIQMSIPTLVLWLAKLLAGITLIKLDVKIGHEVNNA